MRISEGANCSGGSARARTCYIVSGPREEPLCAGITVLACALEALITMSDKPKSEIKVTDRRIFTAEGEIREEFRQDIKPGDPFAAKPAAPVAEKPVEKPAAKADAQPVERRKSANPEPPHGQERRNKSIADKALNPGTALADFVEPLIAQAYMSLGMLRDPYGQKPQVDVAAARQMIEILTMLKEKTAGNLTPDEDDFLSTHLGELKLAFVQRTKSLT